MNLVKLAIRVVLLKILVIMLIDKANAQTTGCGGTFRNFPGSITSPNFPSNYSNNLDCFYYIESTNQNLFDIAFASLQTESCCDWVQVNCSIGYTFSSQRFSGTTLPYSFRMPPCSRVVIQFHTDHSVVDTGFNLTYKLGTCGTFRDQSGIISSDYQYIYYPYIYCYFNIELSPQNAVNINFTYFDLIPSYGWLQVNCSIGTLRSSQKFTGNLIPPFLSIQSCSLVIIQSYMEVPFRGWILRYSIGTGIVGGLTSKPMNAYVLTDTSEDIVLSCASRANQPNQYPWWSYSSDGYTFNVITASNCSLLSFTNDTVYNTTNDYSTRTCNLTISLLYVSAAVGVYTCTDSTLESASALVTVFNPTLRMVKIPSFPSTEVARDDRFMVTCSIQVTQPQYFQVKPSLYLYSDEYQSFIVPSNSTASIIARGSQKGLPSIVCEINFTFAGDVPEGYATNQPQNITLSTPSQKPSLEENKTADTLNTMALIIGVILGSVVLLLLVTVIVLSVCLYRRKNYVRDSKSENNVIEASVNERSRNRPRYEMSPRDTMFAGQGETATSGAQNVAYEDISGETNTYEVLRRETRVL